MTKIGVYSIVFDAHIGVTEEERGTLQQLSVDLELTGEINTDSDHLEDTIDYDTLCRKIMKIGRESSMNLVETLAGKIAQMALLEPRVVAVLVRVKKLRPPLKEIQGGFAVEIQRRRNEKNASNS